MDRLNRLLPSGEGAAGQLPALQCGAEGKLTGEVRELCPVRALPGFPGFQGGWEFQQEHRDARDDHGHQERGADEPQGLVRGGGGDWGR